MMKRQEEGEKEEGILIDWLIDLFMSFENSFWEKKRRNRWRKRGLPHFC
jgi:hypothetical protein